MLDSKSHATHRRRQRRTPAPLRRGRAAILIQLDRLDRPAGVHVVGTDDLHHYESLEAAAAAALEAFCFALDAV